MDPSRWHHVISTKKINDLKEVLLEKTDLKESELSYFIFSDSIKNNAYSPEKDTINLLYKDGSISDIAQAADQLNINALTEVVKKHFVCYPKQSMVDNLKIDKS